MAFNANEAFQRVTTLIPARFSLGIASPRGRGAGRLAPFMPGRCQDDGRAPYNAQ